MADEMGLGKTLQCITLLWTVLVRASCVSTDGLTSQCYGEVTGKCCSLCEITVTVMLSYQIQLDESRSLPSQTQ